MSTASDFLSSKPVMPSVFISHGTPMLALVDSTDDDMDASVAAWHRFAKSLPTKPRAVIALSAHTASSSEAIQVNVAPKLRAWHDFGGFPPALYAVQYDCVGSAEVAEEIMALLLQAESFLNHPRQVVARAQVDHGFWVPMRQLFPEGDVPLVTVSLPAGSTPRDFLALGRALSSLRETGCLILGSGGATHNLRNLVWHGKNAPGDEASRQFEDRIVECLRRGDVETLAQMDQQDFFPAQHPTAEHFYPMLFTIGASHPEDRAEILHRGIEYGCLSMLAFSLRSV